MTAPSPRPAAPTIIAVPLAHLLTLIESIRFNDPVMSGADTGAQMRNGGHGVREAIAALAEACQADAIPADAVLVPRAELEEASNAAVRASWDYLSGTESRRDLESLANRLRERSRG